MVACLVDKSNLCRDILMRKLVGKPSTRRNAAVLLGQTPGEHSAVHPFIRAFALPAGPFVDVANVALTSNSSPHCFALQYSRVLTC
jgi:hypothetical protein